MDSNSQPQECAFICNAKNDIANLETQIHNNHVETKASIDKLSGAIMGNHGVGLKTQVDRLERWAGAVKRFTWIILTAIVVSGVGLAFNIGHLTHPDNRSSEVLNKPSTDLLVDKDSLEKLLLVK